MANFATEEINRGSITLTPAHSGLTTVFFEPTAETLRYLRRFQRRTIGPAKLLEFDSKESRASIYPLNTHLVESKFALPKYDQVRVISLPLDSSESPVSTEQVEWFLEGLPRGFTKSYQYGLGFPREYKVLVDAVESLTSCKEIRFTNAEHATIVDDVLFVPLNDFEVARSELDRITKRAQAAENRVKQAYAHNWLAERTGQEPVAYKRGRHPMIQSFSDAAAKNEPFDEDEIDDLIDVLASQSKSITVTRPGSLAKLRGDIELVELDALISRFSQMLEAGHREETWQDFFVTNPFILSFASGYPFILVQDQASVGGHKLSGGGGKITDFLMKNSASNNVAVFEIKKPNTDLLGATEYRSGVYAPSKELTGSIAQVLDQRYQLTTQFPNIKHTSRLHDIESFSVHACLIVGVTPKDSDKAKSFELFRNSLRDVTVITFDELLARAKHLRSFLSPMSQPTTGS